MKYLFLSILFFLSACSNCEVPNGEYKSFGGTESLTTLVLGADSYTLTYEHWKPADYENRSKLNEQGKWSCQSGQIEIKTKTGSATARLKEVGVNPLGIPASTKALVFNESGNKVLSKEILYTKEMLQLFEK